MQSFKYFIKIDKLIHDEPKFINIYYQTSFDFVDSLKDHTTE